MKKVKRMGKERNEQKTEGRIEGGGGEGGKGNGENAERKGRKKWKEGVMDASELCGLGVVSSPAS